MKKLLVFMVFCILGIGCKEKESYTCKYIIDVGSAAFSVGYCTDSYNLQDNYITFINKRSGKKYIVPREQVVKIEET